MRNCIYFQNLKRFATHLFSQNKQERHLAKICFKSYLIRIFYRDKECFCIKFFPTYKKNRILRYSEAFSYLLCHIKLWFARHMQNVPPRQETILYMLYGIPKPHWEKELKPVNTEYLESFLDKNGFYIQEELLIEFQYHVFFCRKK